MISTYSLAKKTTLVKKEHSLEARAGARGHTPGEASGSSTHLHAPMCSSWRVASSWRARGGPPHAVGPGSRSRRERWCTVETFWLALCSNKSLEHWVLHAHLLSTTFRKLSKPSLTTWGHPDLHLAPSFSQVCQIQLDRMPCPRGFACAAPLPHSSPPLASTYCILMPLSL